MLSYSPSFIIAVRPLLPRLKHSPFSGNPSPVLRDHPCSFHLLPRFQPSVDEGSPQTHTNHPKGPVAVSRQPVAPPNPQQQFGAGVRLVNSSSQQQQRSIFGSSNPQQPQQTQPSIFGIQSTNSLQAQPTLPVNNTTTMATATTAANAGTGGEVFGNTNAGQMTNTGRGLVGGGGGGGGGTGVGG